MNCMINPMHGHGWKCLALDNLHLYFKLIDGCKLGWASQTGIGNIGLGTTMDASHPDEHPQIMSTYRYVWIWMWGHGYPWICRCHMTLTWVWVGSGCWQHQKQQQQWQGPWGGTQGKGPDNRHGMGNETPPTPSLTSNCSWGGLWVE